VVGIRVECSKTNHPVPDICDDLEGDYPKDFKFVGWHPHCRCHVVTILKNDTEVNADIDRILAGEAPTDTSVNTVTALPSNFTKWVDNNKERAKTSYSIPYFVTDNIGKYIPKGYEKYYTSKMPYKTYHEYEAAMTYNKQHAKFTPEVKKNIIELNKVLPIRQGKIMNITEADEGKANPMYKAGDDENKKLGYHHNCQTCTLAYELRRRGFNVKAKPNPTFGTEGKRDFDVLCATHHGTFKDRWLTPKGGGAAEYNWSTTLSEDTIEAKRDFIKRQAKEKGRYEVYCKWNDSNEAHVFIVESQGDGNLMWFDPQTGERAGEFYSYLRRMEPKMIGVLRIDNKRINPKFARALFDVSD